MKKLIASLALALTASVALATTPITEQFINGSYLVVSNNTTLYHTNQTSFLVFNQPVSGGLYNGMVISAYWANTQTNLQPSWASNSVSGFSPGTPYFETNQTIPFTNGAYGTYGGVPTRFGGFVVNTNITNPMAWNDVPAWTKNDGGVGEGCLSVVIAPPWDNTKASHMANTNTFNFVFTPVYDGTNAVLNGGGAAQAMTEGVDKLTLTVAGKGQLIAVGKTNIPAAFFYGAKKIRLHSITSSDASTTTPAWVRVTANGFTGQN